VDVGARQFVEVTAGLNQIMGLSETTTAAERETETEYKKYKTAGDGGGACKRGCLQCCQSYGHVTC